ncbi:MAG: hypothetical protein RLZZ63_154 [Gemmatimonadota bacterium]|jgi:hypothetical protein
MIRSFSQQVVRVVVFATLTVSVAQAQQQGAGSDYSGPGGGGSGSSAGVAPMGVPSGSLSGPLSSAGAAGLSGIVETFGNPGAGGLSISNPAGGTVTIAPATARGISAVLSGGGAPAAQSLQNVLVGESMPAGPAAALVNAMASLGSNPSRGRLAAAIEAYNAAIDAGPSSPSPAMLAIRFSLASASR